MAEDSHVASIGSTVEALARARTAVEDRVRYIRAMHKAGRVEQAGLLGVAQAYAAARADVNGLIERLAAETITTGQPDPATMAASLARAGDAMHAVLEAADRQTLGVPRSIEVTKFVAGLVEGLGKSLVEFWKAVRASRTEQRREVADLLRRQLWLPFDAVPAATKET